MTMTAYDRSWMTFQPLFSDLRTKVGRTEAREYLRNVDPDLVTISLDDKTWSRQAGWRQRNPGQCREFARKRRDGREIAKFFEEVTQWQVGRKRHVMMIGDPLSVAWQEGPVQSVSPFGAQ